MKPEQIPAPPRVNLNRATPTNDERMAEYVYMSALLGRMRYFKAFTFKREVKQSCNT